MQGHRRYGPASDGGVRLELTPTSASPMAIDAADSTEKRIQRLISEHPVVIFSRPSCCMCHVMKRLLSAVGVQPAVIELEEDEIAAAGPTCGGEEVSPALYIGGACVGGLERMVALHISNGLVPKLVEAGALKKEIVS